MGIRVGREFRIGTNAISTVNAKSSSGPIYINFGVTERR